MRTCAGSRSELNMNKRKRKEGMEGGTGEKGGEREREKLRREIKYTLSFS